MKHKENLDTVLVALISSIYVTFCYVKYVILLPSTIYTLIFFVLITFLGLVLIYLSYKDIYSMEVPSHLLYILLGVFVAINILLLPFDFSLTFGNLYFFPINNLFIGLICGGIALLIYLLTKRKGLGEADIYLFTLMGLVLGSNKTILGFYLTLISASIYSIYILIKIKKFKEVKIPLIPFITYGILASLIL